MTAIAAHHVQVEGADFRFQERMRGVVEYMQYREMPAEIKRKVPSHVKRNERQDGHAYMPSPTSCPYLHFLPPQTD